MRSADDDGRKASEVRSVENNHGAAPSSAIVLILYPVGQRYFPSRRNCTSIDRARSISRAEIEDRYSLDVTLDRIRRCILRMMLRSGGSHNEFTVVAPLVGVLLVVGASATAQTATIASPAGAVATLVPIPTVPGTAVLHAGTSVPLRTVTNLTTEGKKLIARTRFDLEKTDAVRVNGAIAIPVGSYATGEITQIRNKRMWASSGASPLDCSISASMVGNCASAAHLPIKLRLVCRGRGFHPVAGLLVTGTRARILAGSSVTSFLEEDLPVVIAAVAAPVALS